MKGRTASCQPANRKWKTPREETGGEGMLSPCQQTYCYYMHTVSEEDLPYMGIFTLGSLVAPSCSFSCPHSVSLVWKQCCRCWGLYCAPSVNNLSFQLGWKLLPPPSNPRTDEIMIIMMLDVGLQQNAEKKTIKLIFIQLIIKYNLLLFI